jgi:hypothetical protein
MIIFINLQDILVKSRIGTWYRNQESFLTGGTMDFHLKLNQIVSKYGR